MNEPKKRLHFNREERHSLQAARVAVFLRRYGRKAQKNTEPNDRRYEHEEEVRIKRLPAWRLDLLMRDDEE